MKLNILHCASRPHPLPWKHQGFGSCAAQKQNLSSLCSCQNFANINSLRESSVFTRTCQRWVRLQGDVWRVCPTCQSRRGLFPLLTKPVGPRGRPKAVRQRPGGVFSITRGIAGSSFPVFMLQLLPPRRRFPSYASLHARQQTHCHAGLLPVSLLR